MSGKQKYRKWSTCSAYYVCYFFFFKERNQVLEVSISVLMNDDGVLEFFSARERNVFEVLLLGSSPSTNINMLDSISMLYVLWRILFFSCS